MLVGLTAGFLFLSQKIFDYLNSDLTILEKKPLTNLGKQKKLHAFKHNGFGIVWIRLEIKK